MHCRAYNNDWNNSKCGCGRWATCKWRFNFSLSPLNESGDTSVGSGAHFIFKWISMTKRVIQLPFTLHSKHKSDLSTAHSTPHSQLEPRLFGWLMVLLVSSWALTRAGQAGAEAPLVSVTSLRRAQTMESSTSTAFTPSSYTCTQEQRCEAFSNSTNTCKINQNIHTRTVKWWSKWNYCRL